MSDYRELKKSATQQRRHFNKVITDLLNEIEKRDTQIQELEDKIDFLQDHIHHEAGFQ